MENNPEYYVQGVCSGNRKALAKTITLIESSLPKHQELITRVLDQLLPFTGNAVRLGITGVPGVGKSTFIESLGMNLVERGHRVAILAVDPSSTQSGGSIMGDKTRMEKLSVQKNAFIRPSPSGGTLGGVSRKTRESLLVCEAAGFDVIMVETVGVGQSEVSVASMVDFFLLLMLAGAGDELQGIKRGILELADAIVVNKADGDNLEKALQAKKIYADAMHLFSPATTDWSPTVLTCSALYMTGIEELWKTVLDYHKKLSASGALEQKRKKQALAWMLTLLEEGLKDWFYQISEVKKLLPELTWAVERGTSTPTAAVKKLLNSLKN
ncbi:MAG: methylmalonyl Co-A mutase-associated GTPase MeaB [Desulfobacteraceae bacterium]|nr:methylmalonyl Co-A mutase-associated GTPase MeaB [Desulfobacteraceae bacterium]MBC2757058.1 methylmalonyl Co-A mutase-associated GTPase MeaB [Desulfobacteraceae bacterium]